MRVDQDDPVSAYERLDGWCIIFGKVYCASTTNIWAQWQEHSKKHFNIPKDPYFFNAPKDRSYVLWEPKMQMQIFFAPHHSLFLMIFLLRPKNRYN